MSRKCPFEGCYKRIASDKFACAEHWHSLNADQQQRIYKCYHDYMVGTISIDRLGELQQEVLAEVQGGAPVRNAPATCRSCGAAIRWLKTVNNRDMPVDAEPTPDGTIDISTGQAIVVGKVRRQSEMFVDEGLKLYKSHFATCPNVAQHRKG